MRHMEAKRVFFFSSRGRHTLFLPVACTRVCVCARAHAHTHTHKHTHTHTHTFTSFLVSQVSFAIGTLAFRTSQGDNALGCVESDISQGISDWIFANESSQLDMAEYIPQ